MGSRAWLGMLLDVALAPDDPRFACGDLAITRVTPEWCAAETGGMILFLVLTSVRTAWLPQMGELIRGAAARSEDGRAVLMSVFRLDKRYPLDLGFDQNVSELREGFRDLAPSIRASSLVLEFGGFLAATMKVATASVRLFGRTKYPTQAHSTVISGAAWLAPYVSAAERRDLRHYVGAVDRMKAALGCER